MTKQQENLRNTGIALSTLAGGIIIVEPGPESWDMARSILAAVLAIAGLVLIVRASKKQKSE